MSKPQSNSVVNTAVQMPHFVVAPSPKTLYWRGFDAYCTGALLADMATEPEQRGWQAAARAEAEAATPGYAAKMGW